MLNAAALEEQGVTPVVMGTCARLWSTMGRDGAGEISHISGGSRMQRKPRVRALCRAALLLAEES